MIRITPAAAQQIRTAAEQSGAQDMCLRIAVTLGDNNAFEYGMGFDDRKDSDFHTVSEGIDVVIADNQKDVLMGATLDYVELNPGEFRFIFTNPNDPAHGTAPAQSDA
jgi:iron-sulfur cluster assembly protein